MARRPALTIDPADRFAVMLSRAAHDASRAFGYEAPPDDAVAAWLARIPPATRAIIGTGIERGLVATGPDGHTFTVAGLSAGKGPYRWFSRNRGPGLPNPNWEYLFQVAEFVRLATVLGDRYRVGFEDGLMDVSLRDGDDLLWYVEVKARATQLAPLLRRLTAHGAPDAVLPDGDRGDDPLRKAKYLLRHRPPTLSLVGGEERLHFAVDYPAEGGFTLRPIDDPLAPGFTAYPSASDGSAP